MANCLQVGKPKPHTAATLDAGDAIDARDAGAGSCLGGPRPDGQKVDGRNPSHNVETTFPCHHPRIGLD